jgi:hypothetical protein
MELGSGAWCWFADPRALTVGATTYAGWIDGAGDVRVAKVDGDLVTTSRLHTGLGVDDHANPALLLRADGRLQVFYSGHGGPELYFRTSADGVEWDAERRLNTNTPGKRGYTYPNPVQLADGRIHLFWRGGDWNPAFSTSADGIAWAPAATLIRVPRQRPYVKVASDGQDTIHLAFTDGHPRETATGLYYARYTAGAWYRAGGRKLPEPPFRPADADRIYDGGRAHAWVHDVAYDADGHPRVVYAVFRSPTDHRYHHARWTGTEWEDEPLTPAGGFFDEDGAEQHYSGGIVFDHADPDVVYLSRPVDGQWEIERWNGPAWTHTAVTSGSAEKNVRPFVVRGGGPPLWMRGAYLNYRRYRTAIVT